MDEARKKRAVAKGQFTRTEIKLKDAMSTRSDGMTTWVLEKRYEDFKVRWDNVQNAHDEYVESLASDEDIKAAESWINELSERFDECELQVGQSMESKESVKLLQRSSASTDSKEFQDTRQGDRDRESSNSSSSKILKVQPMKFEAFGGDMRKYPQFKNDFLAHIKPLCQQNQEVIVLKSYLTEKVREEVNNVGDNASDVWSRLDQKYGNTGKLLDIILSDVKKLSRNENSSDDSLRMIAVVEKAYRDLQRLGKENELYNGTTISIIEESLTTKMDDEWIKLIASKDLDSKQKFLLLFELLKDWRNRLEYRGAEIRDMPEKVVSETQHVTSTQAKGGNQQQQRAKRWCWLHNLEGEPEQHPIWKCPIFLSKPVIERRTLVITNKVCQACLGENCPGASPSKKCSRKFTCSVAGCNEEHNSLLHMKEETGLVNHVSDDYSPDAMNDTALLPLQLA